MTLRKNIDKILGFLLIVLMIVLVVDVVWQVLARYVVKSPSSFTDELARFLLIWVGLFGSAYAVGKKKHLAIDILPSKLKGIKKRNLLIFINILIILFSVSILVAGGIRLVYITLTLEQISPALRIPLGYIYLAVPLSGLFILYYCVEEILELLKTTTD
ncbi:MAG: TRAP transporter small permease [Bacteroidetes bacterium]|jgi:TRAP-type C4-dicarboxylate transport system permease small subunit|nr:TRAP transporter small permease [Bacteroidota bacterium]MBT3750783.1 TRAP transporter small permease [Bacteroidota bacterium]MBT4400070.1 TRAP transporter small permease [Bacteroidota bacterium]MBT4410140.1 TRAP transporter small permease [Bacteroidota bacterium]MBT5425577.1 TRAP transporter small permease [Bacteroidota bacterium]